jgi:argininosuccinate lyase
MFRDAIRALRLVAAALSGAEFNTARMARRAAEGWITVTELADTLVRDHGVPFRAGHAIASRFISSRAADPGPPLSATLRGVCHAILGRAIELDEATLTRVLSPRNFVEVRRTPGGPAPSETGRAIEVSEAKLAADDRWFNATMSRLQNAEQMLRNAGASL